MARLITHPCRKDTRFLEAAVVTTMAAKTVAAEPPPVDTERKRLEALVEKYGSEFGDLRKVR